MGRRFWCVLAIVLLLSVSFHVAESKKKKKVAVVEEEAVDDGGSVEEPKAEEVDTDDSKSETPAKEVDESSEEEEAEEPKAKVKSKKLKAKAVEESEAEEEEAEETEAPPKKKISSKKKKAAEEEEEEESGGSKKEAEGGDDAAEESKEETSADEEAEEKPSKSGKSKKETKEAEAAADEAEAAADEAEPTETVKAEAVSDEKSVSGGGDAKTTAAAIWASKPETKADIDPKGACKRDIKLHCQGIVPGEAQLSLCLIFHVKNEKAGNDVAGVPVSKKCKLEIRKFRSELHKDLSMDKEMEAVCKADIGKFCDDDFLYPEPGNILACLREVDQVEKLADACKARVLADKLEAAEDFVNDPQLAELCNGEAERLCKNVEPGEGRVQDCLREHRSKLAWDCQAELFRQEVENADDIRLNVRLFQACLNDQRKFCADVKYGDARVKDCLEDHRLDSEFSPGCKTEFENMMARRASDFRLDSKLRKYCKGDIAEICYPDAEDISDVANYDAKVIQCLQDYREELKDPKCKAQVHKLTERAAEDIRFDKPLSDACHEDRVSICKDVPDGQAQVFLCLQDHMPQLKENCRNTVFEQLVRMSEDIDFKFPMKRACSEELQKFCKEVPHGHAARIKCLQDNVEDADFGETCRKEVQRDMIRSAEDYRLNYRLHKACLPEIQKSCLHACDHASANGTATCGGTVLKCLQLNKEKLETPACTHEVESFSVMEAKDPLTFNVPLRKACKEDLVKLCPDVSRDHSRTLSCLRTKRDKLSQDCKDEEMRFSMMEASDIRLTPTLMNACGQELQSFCRDLPPTEGVAFKCLQEHLEEVGMGAACKGEVNLQEQRHASNYRLDVRLRKECEEDVGKFCEGADAGQEGHALVLKCMVDSFKSLSGSCQTEVSYAVRMALWQYHKGGELTQACDAPVEELCNTGNAVSGPVKEINGAVIGVYGQCLVSQKRNRLPEGCRKLVKLVAKEGAHAGAIDTAKMEETLLKIKELQEAVAEGASKLSSSHRDTGLVLSGWLAFAALAAVVVVALGIGIAVYYRYFSPHRNYTLVVKSAPPGATGV